jgi:nucleotide-binding universal stress UspA family protein
VALTPHLPDQPSTADQAGLATVVVVGVDDSESSWDAFWWSCGETRRLGGRIVAVFVRPVTGSGLAAAGALAASPTIEIWQDQALTEVAENLQRKLSEAALETGVSFEFVNAKGDAASELLRVAADRHADLIVVGKSSKVLHHLAGSLGRRLIGKRNAPVVVVVP